MLTPTISKVRTSFVARMTCAPTLRPQLPGCAHSTRAGAAADKGPETSTSSESKDDTKDEETWKEPLSASQFFGSYLQVGVWVVVLSAAAFTGFQKAQTNPEDVGLLLAPPLAALLLMGSFVVYRFYVGKDEFET